MSGELAKTALITGGSRGIGAACARLLASEGWRVVINYRQERTAAEALAAELGGMAICADVSDPRAVDEMFSVAGQIDGLVCCAGIAWRGLLTDMTDEEWARVMGVDLSGVFYCCRRALPGMLRRHSGSIVTVSSMWGVTGGSCETAYSAAKAGVIGFTKALAKEVGPSGIRVNCVAPGVIDTDMNRELSADDRSALREETPLEAIGRPEDAAQAVSFLLSERASFITGEVLNVNGGLVI